MPRDCTAIRLLSDVQSRSSHAAPNTMRTKITQKKDRKIATLQKQVSSLSLKKAKATPYADAGGMFGNALGGAFGYPNLGKAVGRYLGKGIGSIFGSGDYTLAGAVPKYNVMMNGSQIPKFDSTAQTNIICHREYIGDITGTAGFSVAGYPLNPGSQTTFPWLSQIAVNYQEYKIHGLIFEFRPLLTDFVTAGSPGVVVMATNYNATAPNYTSKQQMENSEFSVSVKPTINLIHGVECDPAQTVVGQRNIRSGAVGNDQDLRLYDYGTFQFATQGNPVQIIGELWVSYTVEFFKPVFGPTTELTSLYWHLSRSAVSSTNTIGTTTLQAVGTLNVLSNTTSSITFKPNLATTYLVTYVLNTDAATGFSASTSATIGQTGGTVLNLYTSNAGSITNYGVPSGFGKNGVGVQLLAQRYIQSSTSSNTNIVLSFAVDNISGNCVADIFIHEVAGALLT